MISYLLKGDRSNIDIEPLYDDLNSNRLIHVRLGHTIFQKATYYRLRNYIPKIVRYINT